MAITFTAEAIQKIAQNTFPAIYNRKNPSKVDRKKLPGLAMFSDAKETAANNQNTLTVKYQIQSQIDAQGFERRDPLEFSEQDINIDATYGYANVHHGVELVHDDLEAAVGGTVMPNQYPRGKSIVKASSEGEMFQVLNYMENFMEGFLDKRNVNLDKILWTSNAANPKLPSGFDAFWPRIVPTAGSQGYATDAAGTRGYYGAGSIGGRLRSQFPDVLQHYIWANATYTNGGSLTRAVNQARYEAELRSRGRTKGGIKMIVAGRRAAEKYVMYARNNNLNFWADANKSINIDVGLPTGDLKIEGLPLVINPTFADLDLIDSSQALKWDDCMFLVDTDAFAWCYAGNKDAVLSSPPDEGHLRVTRWSLDDKFLLLPKVPNAISIVHLAA